MEAYPASNLGIVERRGRRTRGEVASLIGRSAGAIVHVERLMPQMEQAATVTERAQVVLDLIEVVRADTEMSRTFGVPTTFMMNLAEYCATNAILTHRRESGLNRRNEEVHDSSGNSVLDRLLDVRDSLRAELYSFIEANSDVLRDRFESQWLLADIEQRLRKIRVLIEAGSYDADEQPIIRGLLAECMVLFHARDLGYGGSRFSLSEEDKVGIDLWIGHVGEDPQPLQVKSRLKDDETIRRQDISLYVYKNSKCPKLTLVDWDPREDFFLPDWMIDRLDKLFESRVSAETL